MDYWPSYSDISATARRAYLSWLAERRNAAGADIGHVFLFFYGLERRVLVAADLDQHARGQRATIAPEILRLPSIYGCPSGSFRTYSAGSHDLLAQTGKPSRKETV